VARPSPQTDRVVALVELLASHPDQSLTLADLTRRLGINKSTCHSMLTALTRAGWLLRDPFRKTYRLGPGLIAASRSAAGNFPALEFAHSAMVDLTLELGVNAAALGVIGDHVTVLDQVHDLRASGSRLPVGLPIPLRPPFGTAVVAWRDAASVSRWLAHVPDDTHNHYLAALDVTRRRGYAVEVFMPDARLREMMTQLAGDLPAREDMSASRQPDFLERLAGQLAKREDSLALELVADRQYLVSNINAPVFDRQGAVALVLSISGMTGRLTGGDVGSIGQRLVGVAEKLSAAISAGVEPP
jgi:DNA-binding IclR family transcriptional regulator